MTLHLKQALEAVRRLPQAGQDAIARFKASLAQVGAEEPEEIDPAHLHNIRAGLAQAHRREFSGDAKVAVAFGQFDLRLQLCLKDEQS